MTDKLAKSQAAFENNWKNFWEEPEMVFPKHSRGTYADPTHYIEFKKWQAAEAFGRKQALEDAAEGFIKQKSWMRDYAYAVVQHAAEEGATK